MRKTINVRRLELEHGHGGIVHRELEQLRGGDERSHALALLRDLQEADWQPTGENVHHALVALSRLVLELSG